MKGASVFFVFCLIATGFAKPAVFLGYQDSLGQYSFGYSAPGSARSEVRTSNGATRGTYSYVDETGVIQTAQYIADGENGFRVFATNLPQAPLPVQDTPEVMAARTAHLQALEMAARREEEAQSHREKQVKKIDANLDEKQEQPNTKAAKDTLQEEGRGALSSAKKAEPEESSDESLQAVASRIGANKDDEKNLQSIREEFSGRVTQEITDGANVPSISSHALLPQTLGQYAVPVFRISHGNYEIEPSAIPESLIAQGTSGTAITPAGTALKSGAIPTNTVATPEKGQTRRTQEQANTVSAAIAPLSLIPLSSSHLSFIKYVSPTALHYVAYNVL